MPHDRRTALKREGVLRAFCILGTALAVGLMLLHMAGAGL